jgi:hypothetical protein
MCVCSCWALRSGVTVPLSQPSFASIYQHTDPSEAIIATLQLLRVHLLNYSPSPARNNNSIQAIYESIYKAIYKAMHSLLSCPTYSLRRSVGKGSLGRKAEPLDLASTPSDARYAVKLPLLHKPTLSSLRAPATKDDRETPPGPAASSPRSCKSFIARCSSCP